MHCDFRWVSTSDFLLVERIEGAGGRKREDEGVGLPVDCNKKDYLLESKKIIKRNEWINLFSTFFINKYFLKKSLKATFQFQTLCDLTTPPFPGAVSLSYGIDCSCPLPKYTHLTPPKEINTTHLHDFSVILLAKKVPTVSLVIIFLAIRDAGLLERSGARNGVLGEGGFKFCGIKIIHFFIAYFVDYWI